MHPASMIDLSLNMIAYMITTSSYRETRSSHVSFACKLAGIVAFKVTSVCGALTIDDILHAPLYSDTSANEWPC